MFKLKTTKKSTTNINQNITQHQVSQKKIQLHQNNDIINIQQKYLSQQQIGQSLQLTNKNPPNLLRNTSLRPKSGINRNLTKGSKNKIIDKNDQQLIKQKIKQKLLSNQNNLATTLQNATKLQRPSTSNMNQNSGIRYQRKNKLLNRRGTINNNSGLNATTYNEFPKSQKQITRNIDSENNQNQEQQNSQYISNQSALNILLNILDSQEQYIRLRATNTQQFQRIKQKLISNISIIVLKWYKILQDQLYNQVKNLANKQTQDNEYHNIPKTIEQLIKQQIKKHFIKQNGLFTIEQRCSKQQNKLSKLIDNRLQRLNSLLITSAAHN